jgi:hypothetical protein
MSYLIADNGKIYTFGTKRVVFPNWNINAITTEDNQTITTEDGQIIIIE